MSSQHLQFILFNGVAMLLCLSTFVLFEKVEHHTDIGGELLQNPTFENGLAGWHFSGNVDKNQQQVINLSNWKPDEGHYISQTLAKPASSMVRISADIELIDVIIGEEDWQSARIDILGREKGGEWRWDFRNTLCKETGTSRLRNISEVIVIPAAYSEIRVESELSGGTGTFLVDRISLNEVEPRSSIKFLTHLLLVCWIAVGIAVIGALLQSKMWLPAVLMSMVGILLLLISEGFKLEILDRLENWIPGSGNLPFDHFFLYLTASLIMCFSVDRLQKKGLWLVVLSLTTFSLSTEMLQYYTSHRDPRLLDGITNVIGILTGAMVLLIFRLSMATRDEKSAH